MDGEQDRELELRLLLRHNQAQVELLAARNDVFKHLIDRVLIKPRPAGHESSDGFADAGEEPNRGGAVRLAVGIREHAPEVTVVERGPTDSIVLSLFLVMLPQRLSQ